jgi:hypothetical protein
VRHRHGQIERPRASHGSRRHQSRRDDHRATAGGRCRRPGRAGCRCRQHRTADDESTEDDRGGGRPGQRGGGSVPGQGRRQGRRQQPDPARRQAGGDHAEPEGGQTGHSGRDPPGEAEPDRRVQGGERERHHGETR